MTKDPSHSNFLKADSDKIVGSANETFMEEQNKNEEKAHQHSGSDNIGFYSNLRLVIV